MSDSATGNAKTSTVECIVPILSVRSMAASVDHYVRVLGFKKDWPEGQGPFTMVGLSRDGCAIYLCEGHQGNAGTWVWMGVEDVELVEREYRSSGANIVQPPTNYPWAFEMRVQDIDGHVLRIGSEPKPEME